MYNTHGNETLLLPEGEILNRRQTAEPELLPMGNLRCPPGVSYVLENRRVMKGLFPRTFARSHIQPVSIYPSCLGNMLECLAGDQVAAPREVLLTPGLNNSAYFEHSHLAQQKGTLPNI
jgi:uncharacterized circularly permuted ATP-grasp superfamily protein